MEGCECDACWAAYVWVCCVCCVLGAGAGAKRRRAKPVDPAGEVSCGSRVEGDWTTLRASLEGPCWKEFYGSPGVFLPWGRHGYAPELEVHDWVGLEIWCEDLSVFSQVKLECVTLPSSHGSHDLEGYAPEQVLKGATDAEAMSFENGEVIG